MSGSIGLGANVGAAWVALRFSARGAGSQIRRELNGETAGLGSAIGDKTGKAFNASFAKRLNHIGKTLQSTGKTLSTHLTLPLAAAGAESVKLASDFQSAMEKIRTQAGASQKEVNKMSAAVLKLAKYSENSPQQLAEGLYHLESLGLRGTKALKALKTATDLAAVSGADLESTTSAIGGAWRSGVKGAQSFGKAASTLNAIVGAGNMRMQDLLGALGTGILPSAKTFGLSLKQVGGALALFTDEGVPATDAATRLRMSFSLLGAPSKLAVAQLKRIGIGANQLGNDLRKRGLIGAISDLKKHLEASGLSATKQAALLSRAFGGGRSSAAILSMVNNLDVLRQKQKQVNGSMGKFGDAVKAQRKTAQAQFALMVSSLQRAGIKIGRILVPVVTHIANTVGKLAEKFNGLPASTKKVILVFAGIAAAAGPALIVIGSIARGIAGVAGAARIAGKGIRLGFRGVSGAVKALGRLRDGYRDARVAQSAFSGAAGTLGGKLKTLVTWIGNTSKALVISTAKWVAAKTAAVAAKVAEIAAATASKLMAAAQWLLNAALDANPIGIVVVAIAALVAGLIYAYKHSKTFRKIVQAAFNGVKNVALAVWHWFSGTLVPFFTKTIPNAFHTVLSWVKRNWPWLLGALTGPIGLAVVWIIKHWHGLINGIRSIWDRIVSFVKSIPGRFVQGLSKLGSMLFNVGRNAIQALWNGAKSLAGQVLGWFKNFAASIWHGITGLFSSSGGSRPAPGTPGGARHYDSGGIANGIGFMPKATLKPERVLSPRQTSAFERLVDHLDGTSGGSRPLRVADAKVHFDPRSMEMWIRDLAVEEAHAEIGFNGR